MAKEIQLTQGKVAFVDDEDYEWLSQWKWFAHKRHGQWYARRNYKRTDGRHRLIAMHRQILNASKGALVDHQDHNGLNNTRTNLRFCNHSQNKQNGVRPLNNTSGFKGVYQFRKRWRAVIQANGKRIHIGQFANKLDAAQAYNKAACHYYGEFAWINDIPSK